MSTDDVDEPQPRRHFGGVGVPVPPENFDDPLPEDEIAAWEGADDEQRAALAGVSGAEHLGDLRAVVAGRKLGEALVRAGANLDPDLEADIQSALALVGVTLATPDTEQAALDETSEILSDSELMATIREADADIKAGRVVTTAELIAGWRRGQEPSTAGWRREERRSMWLAAAVAGRIAGDQERAREVGRRNLALMRTTGGGHGRAQDFAAWESLLDGPVEELLAVLMGATQRCRDLRLQAPFAGLLPQDERLAILDAFRAQEAAARGAAAPRSLADILRMKDDAELELPARHLPDPRRAAELDAALSDDLADAALVTARAATDAGARTALDDVIEALGYTRAELEAGDDADRAVADHAALLDVDRADAAACADVPESTRLSWMAALSDHERAAIVQELAGVLRAWRATATAYTEGVPRDQADLTWYDDHGTGPYVVDVVASSLSTLAAAIPAPAEQVVTVTALHEVEPVARTLLGAALGVPGDDVPLVIRVDSLSMPGSGDPHIPGRAVLVTATDEGAIAAAELLLEAAEPWTDALEATGGRLTQAERVWADEELGGAGGPDTGGRLEELIDAGLIDPPSGPQHAPLGPPLMDHDTVEVRRALAETNGASELIATIRALLGILRRERWLDQARADAADARDENLGGAPDAW
ncbi:hypothetical protein ICW40_05715 [Actinotalea ferrariae]|uniref:hypothetical protein n=1 Tax=Actinotalea ferrariae TaxID=1386098 RepID=UPI001C8BF66D|nr:hypothetical protein [Actinotalea ferrariae]MBX9244303.1 hypothetical protein [Actinotalea ferrariae]